MRAQRAYDNDSRRKRQNLGHNTECGECAKLPNFFHQSVWKVILNATYARSLKSAHDPGRHSDGNRIFGHILGYDCSSANYASMTDVYAGKDNGCPP